MQCRTCSKSTLKLKASPTTTCQLQPSPMSSSRCGTKYFKILFVSTYFNNMLKQILNTASFNWVLCPARTEVKTLTHDIVSRHFITLSVLDNVGCNQVQKNYHTKETFSRHFKVQEMLFNQSTRKWEDLQDMCHFEILPGESLKRLLHQIGHHRLKSKWVFADNWEIMGSVAILFFWM